MPIYTYQCEKCGNTDKFFRNASKADDSLLCKKCGYDGKHKRLVPSNVSGRAMETRDEYRKKSVVQDTERMVSDRATDAWKKVELPQFIEEHGMEEAIRNGWVDPETKRPK